MSEALFEMSHTRVKAQRDRMIECARLDICPFCWENLAEWHDAPVIIRGEFWVITKNDHPYPGAKHHFLAIYRDHISSITEADPEAGIELLAFFSRVSKENNISGATVFMRFGEMAYNGATVFHLHAHLISGVSREHIPEPDKMENWLMAKVGYKV